MNNNVAFLARTIATKFHCASSPWRFYCSSSSVSTLPSSNKLFVGGLSWSVDEKSLKDAFSAFGEVTEVKILYDKESGRPRGFGFVIFSNEDNAKCAKDAMDGKGLNCIFESFRDRVVSSALLGRPLRISFALEKARGGPVVVPRISDIGHINRRRT